MKTDPNAPASPCKTFQYSGHPMIGDQPVFNPGLSKREFFAAMALAGITAKSAVWGTNQGAAAIAVRLADALIEDLNKPEVVKK